MEEQLPETPNLSVTIPLSGEPFQTVSNAMLLLREAIGKTPSFSPHVTLQQIYSDAKLEEVIACLQRIGKTLTPFELEVSGIGLLSTPGKGDRWHLHLHIKKSPEILALYLQITEQLQHLGLRTYDFTAEDWIPHLTLASGSFSRKTLRKLIRKLEGVPTAFTLKVNSMEIHQFQSDGEWLLIDRLQFARNVDGPRVLDPGVLAPNAGDFGPDLTNEALESNCN